MTSFAALEPIWTAAGCERAALERVALAGADPMLPTDIKIGTAATAVITATGLAATEVWRLRTGRAQSVAVDMRAAIAAFRSERYPRVDGGPAVAMPLTERLIAMIEDLETDRRVMSWANIDELVALEQNGRR